MVFVQGPETETKLIWDPQLCPLQKKGQPGKSIAQISSMSGNTFIVLFQRYKMYLQTQLNHLNQGSLKIFIKKLITELITQINYQQTNLFWL
jgi:hypothetical protein